MGFAYDATPKDRPRSRGPHMLIVHLELREHVHQVISGPPRSTTLDASFSKAIWQAGRAARTLYDPFERHPCQAAPIIRG